MGQRRDRAIRRLRVWERLRRRRRMRLILVLLFVFVVLPFLGFVGLNVWLFFRQLDAMRHI